MCTNIENEPIGTQARIEEVTGDARPPETLSSELASLMVHLSCVTHQ